MGKKRLLLGVHAENAKALGFYRKNGFEQVGTRTFQVGASVFHDFVLGRPV
jgi:diamine N-acetyltransferase